MALVGVRDSVVVHTADVTMVCPVADAEGVKRLLAEPWSGATDGGTAETRVTDGDAGDVSP